MIRNKTRKTLLCRETEKAESPWKKALGLMFRSPGSFPKDRGMLFIFRRESRQSFWTPFVRFPIDILFMDSSRRVLDIRENLGPWRMASPSSPARYVLELRAGRAGETGTRKGDLLEFRI